MYYKKVQFLVPLNRLRARQKLSERETAERAGISRSTLRHVEAGLPSVSVSSVAGVAEALGAQTYLIVSSGDADVCSDLSTVGVSYSILRDGFDSWKIHLMNLVDEFRRTLDPQLLLLPPPSALSQQLMALLASIVVTLSREAEISAPHWTQKIRPLEEPWFVAGVDALKATALMESPLAFRRNHIFVLGNFLKRA